MLAMLADNELVSIAGVPSGLARTAANIPFDITAFRLKPAKISWRVFSDMSCCGGFRCLPAISIIAARSS